MIFFEFFWKIILAILATISLAFHPQIPPDEVQMPAEIQFKTEDKEIKSKIMGSNGTINCPALKNEINLLIREYRSQQARNYMSLYLWKCVDKSDHENFMAISDRFNNFLKTFDYELETETQLNTRLNRGRPRKQTLSSPSIGSHNDIILPSKNKKISVSFAEEDQLDTSEIDLDNFNFFICT